MRYLEPEKLQVEYLNVTRDSLKIPRRYTLTHSDLTGNLYLTIGSNRSIDNIFMKELPLVLEAIRYGDRELFTANPELDESRIVVRFQSSQIRSRKTEDLGEFSNYR